MFSLFRRKRSSKTFGYFHSRLIQELLDKLLIVLSSIAILSPELLLQAAERCNLVPRAPNVTSHPH